MQKVLIVEPVSATARSIEHRLRQAGFEAHAVDTAGAASAIVFNMRPDLIILDIDTPRYSGIDFHEYLLTTRRGRGIPVLYLTRHDNWINREETHRLDAAGLLIKPCRKAALLTAVFRALGSRRRTNTADARSARHTG